MKPTKNNQPARTLKPPTRNQAASSYQPPLQWLRLWTDFATNPKVQMLDEAMQRRFVMLLCHTAMGLIPTDDDAAVAFALRLSPTDIKKTKTTLVKARLIGNDWRPLGWDRRQYKSDHDAAERKRRQRTRERDHRNNSHADVPAASRDSHDLEQSRAESETDSDQNRAAAARAHARENEAAAAADEKINAERQRWQPEQEAFAQELDQLGVTRKTARDWAILRLLIGDHSRADILAGVRKARTHNKPEPERIPPSYLSKIVRKHQPDQLSDYS